MVKDVKSFRKMFFSLNQTRHYFVFLMKNSTDSMLLMEVLLQSLSCLLCWMFDNHMNVHPFLKKNQRIEEKYCWLFSFFLGCAHSFNLDFCLTNCSYYMLHFLWVLLEHQNASADYVPCFVLLFGRDKTERPDDQLEVM